MPFVIIRQGVYRHEIASVCHDLDSAKSFAEEALRREQDKYHDYIVLEVDYGQPVWREMKGAYTDQCPFEDGKEVFNLKGTSR